MQKTSYIERSEWKIRVNQMLQSSYAGPEATPFTSSPLQIAILFCKTIRIKICMLLSVVGVGDSIKQLNVSVGKM